MHRSVVALFCIIFVVGVHGAARKTSASIDKDTVDIVELVEKLWSLKPAIVKRTKTLVYCQIMDECCEDKDRSEAASLMFDNMVGMMGNRFVEIMETCMNTTNSNKENQLCSVIVKSIVPSWMVFRNSDVKKYMNIMNKYMNNLEKFNYLTVTCNSEEIHAFACSSDTKLVESCAGKILQQIYDYDYKNYEKTIQYIKRILTDGYQEIFEVFIKNMNSD